MTPHDPIKQELDRILTAPRGYVFCAGQSTLWEEPSAAAALSLLHTIDGWETQCAVLLETPLPDVYLQIAGAGVETERNTSYEFCTVEDGRLVPFLRAMHGHDRTRLLIKFCQARAFVMVRALQRGDGGEVAWGRVFNASRGWVDAQFRLSTHMPSRLMPNVVVPRGTCGLPS